MLRKGKNKHIFFVVFLWCCSSNYGATNPIIHLPCWTAHDPNTWFQPFQQNCPVYKTILIVVRIYAICKDPKNLSTLSMLYVPSLKLTFSPLKMDGFNTILSYWGRLFSGAKNVGFREGCWKEILFSWTGMGFETLVNSLGDILPYQSMVVSGSPIRW